MSLLIRLSCRQSFTREMIWKQLSKHGYFHSWFWDMRSCSRWWTWNRQQGFTVNRRGHKIWKTVKQVQMSLNLNCYSICYLYGIKYILFPKVRIVINLQYTHAFVCLLPSLSFNCLPLSFHCYSTTERSFLLIIL